MRRRHVIFRKKRIVGHNDDISRIGMKREDEVDKEEEEE